ncbi:uncharacterized protein LOC130636296 [Hydractinia symbiolongicarpus]|uniref:uncharacterized protein LOC130636296 n=1 Tax=Hydractinia symbiolongicarpus TaxID=13093 RepID=UPI00254CC462|nr:uncharacterized protein LOC130636296 [Hydractinia symbiolongicarpus]
MLSASVRSMLFYLVLVFFCQHMSLACEFELDILFYDAAKKSLSSSSEIICLQTVCDEYFLQISLFCPNKSYVGKQMAMLGFQPHVNVQITAEFGVSMHIIETALVESKDCLCNDDNSILREHFNDVNTDDFGSQTNQCNTEKSTATNNTHCVNKLCDLLWLARLQVTSATKSLKISVSDNGLGISVSEKDLVHSVNTIPVIPDVHHLHENFTHGGRHKKIVKSDVGNWYLHIHNGYVLFTQSEFERSTLKQFNMTHMSLLSPLRCNDDSPEILDMSYFDGCLLLATKFGVFKYDNSSDSKLVLSKCIKKLVGVGTLKYAKEVVVLGVDGKSIFWKSLDMTGSFSEVQNADGHNLYSWLAPQWNVINLDGFQIMDVTKRLTDDCFLVLLNDNQSNVLVEVKVINSSWHYQMVNGNIVANVSHITTTKSNRIFFWGEQLFMSLNNGEILNEIVYDDTSIATFLVGDREDFFFVTHSNKLWYGLSDVERVIQLKCTPSLNHLAYFFTSNGVLKEVRYTSRWQLIVASSNESCFKSQTIDIKSQLHSALSSQVENNLRTICTSPYLDSCSPQLDYLGHHSACPYLFLSITPDKNGKYSRIKTMLSHYVNRVQLSNIYSLDDVTNELRTDVIDAEQFSIFEPPERFPEEISLGLNECYEVNISIGMATKTLFSHHDVIMKSSFTPLHELSVGVTKMVDYLDGVIIFQVTLCDTGVKRTQNFPGDHQTVSHALFQINPSDLECLLVHRVKTNINIKVLHGCVSDKTVVLNLSESKKEQRHFCEEENCFYYDKPFKPVFMLVDEITGDSVVFPGKYNLTIVGGGNSIDEITLFSDQERYDFNHKLGASLVWAWSSSDNAYQWLCGNLSPCGGITPVFPSTPEYYFQLQFSNRDIDQSNCDYTFQFTIKVHGMPPDGLYPSLLIVLLSIAFMGSLILLVFFLETRFPDFFTNSYLYLTTFRTLLINCLRPRNKIDASLSSKTLHQKVLNWIQRNGGEDASIGDFTSSSDDMTSHETGTRTSRNIGGLEINDDSSILVANKATSMSNYEHNKENNDAV